MAPAAGAALDYTVSYRLAADAVLLAHLAFILLVIFGAGLTAKYRWFPWIQLPSAAWGAYIEISGSICPLTYLENDFRMRAGQANYAGSFIEHYLLAIIYPAGLTREIQFALAGAVVLVNIAIYAWLLRRRRIGPHGDG